MTLVGNLQCSERNLQSRGHELHSLSLAFSLPGQTTRIWVRMKIVEGGFGQRCRLKLYLGRRMRGADTHRGVLEPITPLCITKSDRPNSRAGADGIG